MNIRHVISNPLPYIRVGRSKIKNVYRTYAFKGNLVFCEICNWNGKQFFDGKCPKCKSLARTRLFSFALQYFALLNPQDKILHIAPNLNEFKFISKKLSHANSYDRLNIKPVKHINIVEDLTQTSLASDYYDIVIAWHVLEHIPKDINAISEVYRLLKHGGHFLVSVPIYPLESETTFEDANISYADYEKIHGHYDHCRSCGLDYKLRFENLGFSTKTLMVKDVFEGEKVKYGLFEHHVVWCFTK